jgi:hypothetical protein
MDLGFALLAKLGMSENAASAQKTDVSATTEAIYARDQSGIGFTEVQPDFLKATEAAFAKIQSAAKIEPCDEPGRMTVKATEPRFFIPARLRKKSVKSLSSEDLACILASSEPVSLPMDSVPLSEDVPEGPHKRRKKRHRHEVQATE